MKKLSAKKIKVSKTKTGHRLQPKKTTTEKTTKKTATKIAKKVVKKTIKKSQSQSIPSKPKKVSKKVGQQKQKIKPIKKKSNSEIVREEVVKSMESLKAKEIIILDLRKIKNAVADFFILASGTSDTHIKAIAEGVEKQVYVSLKEKPWHVEGRKNKEWLLLDFTDVVVHIFLNDRRRYYALEELWGDAKITKHSE